MNARYSFIAIILHWMMAALLLFMIWLGWNMEGHEARFQFHKSIGITLLILTVARVLWRVFNKPPPLPADVRARDKLLSELVQFGFYALMILIPLGGWAMVSSSPFQVPTVLYEAISWPDLPLPRSEGLYRTTSFLHENGAKLLLVLLALHVAGALKHEISDESGVLKRMVPGLFGPTDPPGKGRGALAAFGGAAALFVALSAIPVLSSGRVAATDRPKAAVIDANWEMLEGSISFDFSHDGTDYSGTFNSFTPRISFDANNLSAAAVFVTVDLQDIDVPKKLYKDSLMAPEWFDVKTSPEATVRLDNFVSTSTGFTADAHLALKDKTVTTPFVFGLTKDGDDTRMSGEAVFTRTALDLGMESDPTADWVSENITVKVNLLARAK